MTGKATIRYACAIILLVLAVGPAWAQSGDYRHEQVVYGDDEGVSLLAPAGVACGKGRIFVADTRNSRIVIYGDKDGEISVVNQIKLKRSINPSILQLGPDGEIFVYDRRAKKILRFEASGIAAGQVEPQGVPGSLQVIPKSFRVDSAGDLYLLDVFGRRVVVLEKGSGFVRAISFPEEFGFFSDLAVDERDRVFILDSILSQVFVASPEEKVFKPFSDTLKGDLDYPTRLETHKSGKLFVVDEETSTIGVLRRDGSFEKRLFNRGRKEGLLYYPAQICFDDDNRLIIADRDNNRVQLFGEKE